MKLLFLILLSFSFLSCSKKNIKDGPAFAKGGEWKTDSPVVKLGYQLYFDKRLSYDDTVSCNTCHDIMYKRGGVDGAKTSSSVDGTQGRRNALSVWNSKFFSVYSWDGKNSSILEQAKGSIIDPAKMGMEDHEVTLDKIKKINGYKSLFKEAYPNDANPITADNLAGAIAEFVKTLVALNSPYDKYKAGDKTALTSLAVRGMNKFNELGCVSCHSGDHFAGPKLSAGQGHFKKFPVFSNEELEEKHNLIEDQGVYERTSKSGDESVWRVPSLRNVAITAPYLHNGSIETLDEVVTVMAKLQLNKILTANDKKTLVAFLESLNSDLPQIKEPQPVK